MVPVQRVATVVLMVLSLMIAAYLFWGAFQTWFNAGIGSAVFLGATGFLLIEVYTQLRWKVAND